MKSTALYNLSPDYVLQRCLYEILWQNYRISSRLLYFHPQIIVGEKIPGITAWVEKLRSDNFLATLSGFDSDKTPGVGTFYDFLKRLWLETKKLQRYRRPGLSSLVRKPSKKLKAGQKLKVKRPQVVNRLVSQIIDLNPLRAMSGKKS